MTTKRYLEVDVDGGQAERVPVVISTGVTEAGQVVATGSDGYIDLSLLPNFNSKSVVAGEALSANDLVYLYDSGSGVVKMKKADASGGRAKRAMGFVRESVLSAASGVFHAEGMITGMSGLTPGTKYFLSGSSAGGVTLTPVTTADYILQEVGYAESTTELSFEAKMEIVRK